MVNRPLPEDVFTPGTDAKVNFISRPNLENRLVDALRTPGMQVIVYGQSGSGKSTLVSKLLERIYEEEEVRVQCESTTTFSSILQTALSGVGANYFEAQQLSEKASGRSGGITISGIGSATLSGGKEKANSKSQKTVTAPPMTSQTIATYLGEANRCLVIEDFQVLREEHKLSVAEMLKVFKDFSGQYRLLRIIAIGTADTARQLVAYSPHMESRVAEVLVPLMSEDELRSILENGEKLLNAEFASPVKEEIVKYASGLPGICHELALYACQALEWPYDSNEKVFIGSEPFSAAKKRYLESRQDTIKAKFDKARKEKSKAKYPHYSIILTVLASGPDDGMTADTILDHIRRNIPNYGRPTLVHYLEDLLKEERGALIRFNSDSGYYSFFHPLYRSHAKMLAPPSIESLLPETSSEAPAAQALPKGISNTSGWTVSQIREELESVKKNYLDWENTTGSAQSWWGVFERENEHRLALVLRLAEELKNRSATITEFFLAYVYSNTDNIQANLHYLDYTKLKKGWELKQKKTADHVAEER